MIKAGEGQVLAAFEQVHGKMNVNGSCHAEVVYNEDYEIIAVACMKNGVEAWRATLAEITFDLLMDLNPDIKSKAL